MCRADHQAEFADGPLRLSVLLPRNGENLSVLKKQMINTFGALTKLVTAADNVAITDGKKDLPWSSGEQLGGSHHKTHTAIRGVFLPELPLPPDH